MTHLTFSTPLQGSRYCPIWLTGKLTLHEGRNLDKWGQQKWDPGSPGSRNHSLHTLSSFSRTLPAPRQPSVFPCSTGTPLGQMDTAEGCESPGSQSFLGLSETLQPLNNICFCPPASISICFGWKNKPFCCCEHFKGTRRAARYPLERHTRNRALIQMY